MSFESFELTPDNPYHTARLLETEPVDKGVAITIDEGATGRDVFATLSYHEPDQNNVDAYLQAMLAHQIEKDGRTIDTVKQKLIEDVGLEEAQKKLRALALECIDEGAFAGRRIIVRDRNEFTKGSDEKMSKEAWSEWHSWRFEPEFRSDNDSGPLTSE